MEDSSHLTRLVDLVNATSVMMTMSDGRGDNAEDRESLSLWNSFQALR
jgi:hypothetical protein